MKMFIAADICGRLVPLETVLSVCEKENPDLIICPGNMTDMFDNPREFSQVDVGEVVLQKMLSLGKPVLTVPGNHDPFEILDVFSDYNTNLHNKHVNLLGTDFIGFGGALTPFKTNFEPTEEETRASLESLVKKTKKPFILVTHNPPKNTKIDMIEGGKHVGSGAVREFVLKHKPILAISAHIHEAPGVDMLGTTTVFNPGPVVGGKCGVVDVRKNKVKCRIIEP